MHKNLILVCMVLGFAGVLCGQPGVARDPTAPVAIERISFLIHPFCYRVPRPAAYDSSPEARARWDSYVAYESKVAQRWFQRIASLGPQEVLVICAARVGCPSDLRDYAEKHLGRRVVVIEDYLDQPNELANKLSAEAKVGLGEELMELYRRYGKDWNPQLLAVPIVARGWVERLYLVFGERDLSFDPATVQVDAWGESFEGCVASYARFLGTYLGLAEPIENDYEMTVPDAPFLLTAKFLERIPLERDVRLYLWETADGQTVAMFQKARVSVAEPALYARFPISGLQIELKNKTGRQMWPENLPHEKDSVADALSRYNEARSRKLPESEKNRREKDSSSSVVDGELQVPLAVPLDSEGSYIFFRGTTTATVRSVLIDAKFVEQPRAD